MSKDLFEQDIQLRKEANVILFDKRLKTILSNYGKVQVHGSYYLQLMTWRDLDIYVQNDEISISQCFDLAKELAMVLCPFKISYKNNLLQHIEKEPDGIYFGIKTKSINDSVWKMDIWILDTKQFNEKFGVCEKILNSLTSENRKIILNIKDQLCHHPDYRGSITSFDIYEAVLSKNVKNVEEFWASIKK